MAKSQQKVVGQSLLYATPAVADESWKAALSLSFESGPSRTVVRREHTGPLTVQRPFYPEGSVAHVYLLHPPGGVVGGDALTINARVSEHAAGLVTTPGATKFYRSTGAAAIVNTMLDVRGGSLEWFPQENILFNGCEAKLMTTVSSRKDAALALWDIQCFGRPAGNEPFRQGSISNTLTILVDDIPMFHDRQVINATHPLSHQTTYRQCTVCGSLLINRVPIECVELARQIVTSMPEFFITCVDSLLVVRYLGDSAQQAKQGFCSIWSRLRHLINQQPPCIPRIWAT